MISLIVFVAVGLTGVVMTLSLTLLLMAGLIELVERTQSWRKKTPQRKRGGTYEDRWGL